MNCRPHENPTLVLDKAISSFCYAVRVMPAIPCIGGAAKPVSDVSRRCGAAGGLMCAGAITRGTLSSPLPSSSSPRSDARPSCRNARPSCSDVRISEGRGWCSIFAPTHHCAAWMSMKRSKDTVAARGGTGGDGPSVGAVDAASQGSDGAITRGTLSSLLPTSPSPRSDARPSRSDARTSRSDVRITEGRGWCSIFTPTHHCAASKSCEDE